jgi:hypothetical protein
MSETIPMTVEDAREYLRTHSHGLVPIERRDGWKVYQTDRGLLLLPPEEEK